MREEIMPTVQAVRASQTRRDSRHRAADDVLILCAMDDNSKPDRDGMSASMRLSIHMQAISDALSAILDGLAGEFVPFVLILEADGIAQYVSSLQRQDGVELMIESLLARSKAGRADIPAHYNPDLKKG